MTADWPMGLADREIRNIEGRHDFDRSWRWATTSDGGITAVLRVRDEAANLPFVLPPLFGCVSRLVLVDNLSTDGTADVAAELASRAGAESRLEIVSYPFDVARCGSDHRMTSPASVHSLTYFYNWSFSHATTPYAMKWDGDMVLTEAGVRALRAAEWQLEGRQVVASFKLPSVWLLSDSVAYIDVEVHNHEPRLWPNREGVHFLKAWDYETVRTQRRRRLRFDGGYCFELKRLSADEFDHWTDVDDFLDPSAQPKKGREWSIATALRSGSIPDGVTRVDAEPGEHVVETIRRLPLSRWPELVAEST